MELPSLLSESTRTSLQDHVSTTTRSLSRCKLKEKQCEIYPGLSSTGKVDRLYSNNWSMHSLYKFVGDVCTFSIYNNQNLEAWFLRVFAAAAPWMSLTDSSVTGLMGDGL